MKQILILPVLVLFFIINIAAQSPAIIPLPKEIKTGNGYFSLNQECTLKFDTSNEEVTRIAGFFNEYLENIYGFKAEGKRNAKTISFKLQNNLKKLGKEGYRLKAEKNNIEIEAFTPNGLFYGMQSLKQLLPLEATNDQLNIPCIEIKDEPRFAWRGNMLDVGRHFFPVSFLKKYIDILAMYKINTFHWHLTEDQGWRLEIKKYPLLTEISHWRDETIVGHALRSDEYDGIGYGGFYTQDQAREIVRYAAERYITVVPEIEMPGHSSAALAAYPNLGCTGGPYEVKKTWGVHKDVYCAGKEETFTFLQDVLNEVLDIFPSEFIHVGGDECPKDAWEVCENCQRRIKKEGLQDEHELQSWFITRMDGFLTSKGRRLIGWDEILEGGLAPQATVMSWRGIKGGIEAAKQKHDVVMSPTTHMYLDYYQSEDKNSEPLAIGGFLPLDKVYGFEPVPEELSRKEAKYIIGVQSNLWTEYVSNTEYAEYMLLPRLQAQSEVSWTPKEQKDFADFEKRLQTDYHRLKKLGIKYRKHTL
ncbi:beta-N-acetylglucosaminidase [Mariniphaga sediminis]|uniref:beta-N-acetylhexosaminidase n=1 Tax=Mariniphaga sediminis TaxID=1628158 RepID=A0A399D4A7_9BACT|nr:beta-N-acetylhexosaminidase [Mariniphaga sediminis]RIH65502.1 beta-N-acetylglucosaminidase [Mariniphaga sediminis]